MKMTMTKYEPAFFKNHFKHSTGVQAEVCSKHKFRNNGEDLNIYGYQYGDALQIYVHITMPSMNLLS